MAKMKSYKYTCDTIGCPKEGKSFYTFVRKDGELCKECEEPLIIQAKISDKVAFLFICECAACGHNFTSHSRDKEGKQCRKCQNGTIRFVPQIHAVEKVRKPAVKQAPATAM